MLGEEDEMCVVSSCMNPSGEFRHKSRVCRGCYDRLSRSLGESITEVARMMIKRARDRRPDDVSLDREDILRVWPTDNRCPIMGTPFSIGGDLTNSPSLDRIDSSKGYTPENIQIISYMANNMKSSADTNQLAKFAKYYYKEDTMLDTLINNFVQWHKDRNLIDGSTDQAQYVKLIEEAGELAGNIARGKDVSDDIGDMIVILTNIAARNQLTLAQCCEQAWNDIKDRKGKMVDGVFIKESE